MQEYCFIGCTTYSDETTEVLVELTDEESERLEEYGKKASVFYDGFENCEELTEIYEKIYKVAVQQMTEEVREYGEDDNCEDPDWKIDDTYACWVNFPSEWEEELEEDEEDEEDE